MWSSFGNFQVLYKFKVISKTYYLGSPSHVPLSVFACTASASVSVILNGRRELTCIAHIPFNR